MLSRWGCTAEGLGGTEPAQRTADSMVDYNSEMVHSSVVLVAPKGRYGAQIGVLLRRDA